MMKLKLSRDEARLADEKFFGPILMIYKMKVRDAPTWSAEWCNQKVLLSLIIDVRVAFKKKLLSSSNTFIFNFSDGHGIALYHLLMQYPVDTYSVYNVLTRQKICNTLHAQIISPLLE
ncbi:hypothetical protein I5907_11990 [Panacibacter sp. DH6]|uniref:Uncharacterized protein n=1 Tax=Panacibacter microcysteis TaxID=2793269 RepID=A0A931E1M0_9BACT|nr:hypothetical protein [Panacibacter microcysteis]MBG9376957.1 hypothetical protein [Panacibacter microcysteis]